MVVEFSNHQVQTSWAREMEEAVRVRERLRAVARIAGLTDQRKIARELQKWLDVSQNVGVRLLVVSKPHCGGEDVMRVLGETFHCGSADADAFVSTSLLEKLDLAEISGKDWEEMRTNAAVVVVIPALAPLFDDTVETMRREFAPVAQRLFFVIGMETEMPPAAYIKSELAKHPALGGAPVLSLAELGPALAKYLRSGFLEPMLLAQRMQLVESSRQLLPLVKVFAELLSADAAQYQRRLDFIRRDVEPLRALAVSAHKTLEAQSQKALAGAGQLIAGLGSAMQQKADEVMRGLFVPRDVLASQDLRTRFGREVTARVRIAADQEVTQRLQRVATNLTNARSVLFSSLDQMREEAAVHVEELSHNVGHDLFQAWMREAVPDWSSAWLETVFDPGTSFPAAVEGVGQKIWQGLPLQEFNSSWASRVEAIYRAELTGATSTTWTAAAVDGPAIRAVAQVWSDMTEAPAGKLIGKVEALVAAVSGAMAASRFGSLQLPADPSARKDLSAIYAGFAKELAKETEIGSRNQEPE
jgi:hypothetical protein